MSDVSFDTVNEIKNLKRKCALQQFCHYELASRVGLTAKILNVTLVLLSGLTVLSTTDHAKALLDNKGGPMQSQVSALFAILVFLLTLLRMELRFSEIANSFRAGGDAFTRYLRKIDMLIPVLDSMQGDEINRLGMQLTDEYSRIADFAREIPGRDFLRLKQKHLQRKAVSKALDENPFLNLSDKKSR
ncbi:MAG: SLATT domain-containing protein [Chloroflexi bacterium]|nr:SLATT domain-containing protein [Chloroflexota bacterium]